MLASKEISDLLVQRAKWECRNMRVSELYRVNLDTGSREAVWNSMFP